MSALLKIAIFILAFCPVVMFAQVKLQRNNVIAAKRTIALKDVSITSPTENQVVKSPLTVKGTSNPNADVQLDIKVVFEGGEEELGIFEIKSNSNGEWNSIPINLWVPENAKNSKFIIAALKAGEMNTNRGDKVTVSPMSDVTTVARKDLITVGLKEVKLRPAQVSPALLESLKGAPPVINSPRSSETVGSPLVIKGTGEKNVTIEVDVRSKYDGGEQHLGLFRTKSDAQGIWQTIPINLWAPAEAKNLSYSIKATQHTEDKGESRAANITVRPKSETVMVLRVPQNIRATPTLNRNVMEGLAQRTEKKAAEKAEAERERAADGPVSEPIIISPQSGTMLQNDRFQIMGTGIPHSQVNAKVFVSYFNNRRKQEKVHELQTRSDGNGVWRTQMTNYSIPSGAYDIRYDIQCEQIRQEDSKRSRKSRSLVTQVIGSPKMTTFVYKAPDLPSTRTGKIWDWINNEKYRESFVLKGTGGPGLQLHIILDVVRAGVQSGGRTGTVEVGSDGNWKWETAWKYTDDSIDSFVIKLTQSNPGNDEDRSNTVVEYRTK